MTSHQEWDERFRRGSHTDPTTDPFFDSSRRCWDLIPARNEGARATALDVACGAGRHAVALAEAGFDVTAADFSVEALRKGEELARRRGVEASWIERNLEGDDVDLGYELYDLVTVFFFLHRPLFPVLNRCLKPGGLLIYKTYSVDQLRYPGRPKHRMYLLEHNELLRAFDSFRVLVYEEQWEGKGTAALIAQRL